MQKLEESNFFKQINEIKQSKEQNNLQNLTAKCLKGNVVKLICSNKNCNKPGLTCFVDDCECQNIHIDCQMNFYKKIINSFSQKVNSLDLEQKIQEIFNKAIDQLSDHRDKLLKQCKLKNQVNGLSEDQKYFIKCVKQNKTQQITGKFITEIKSSQKKVDVKQINEFVQQFIKKQQNKLKNSLKQFQQKISQVLRESFEGNFGLRKINSTIIKSSQHVERLDAFFSSKFKYFKLLYRASENNFETVKFYEKCSNKPHTLTIVETEFGKIIGGYTPLEWKIVSNGEYVHDQSGQSFIFSLTNNHKFQYNKDGNAIQRTNGSSYGPVFGCGHDLVIYNKANENNSSGSYINSTYHNNNYKCGDKDSWLKFNGNQQSNNFKVKEWQVYQLFF